MPRSNTPSNPGFQNEGPDYLVTPRYLAGSDGDTATVTDLLVARGWTTFTDETSTTRCFPRDQRCCVCIRGTRRSMSGRDPMWRLWGRQAGKDTVDWNATFTTACPPEIIACVAEELTAPPSQLALDEHHGMQPLNDAQWNRNENGYIHPDGQVAMRYSPAPFYASQEEISRKAGWTCTVATSLEAAPLWGAAFSISTPWRLITAFCEALIDPEPVPRYDCDIDDSIRPYLRLR